MFTGLLIRLPSPSGYTLYCISNIAWLYEQNVNTERAASLVHPMFLLLEDAEKATRDHRHMPTHQNKLGNKRSLLREVEFLVETHTPSSLPLEDYPTMLLLLRLIAKWYEHACTT